MFRKKKYILLMFQNIIQIMKYELFLMVQNREGCSKIVISIIKRNNIKKSDFYCFNCIHSFRAKNKLEQNENKDFCIIIMLPENTKIFEFNQYQKSDKASFVGYADLEYLIEKTDGCKNNPENSSATKLGEHIPSGFSMSTISSFKNIEHGHDVY